MHSKMAAPATTCHKQGQRNSRKSSRSSTITLRFRARRRSALNTGRSRKQNFSACLPKLSSAERSPWLWAARAALGKRSLRCWRKKARTLLSQITTPRAPKPPPKRLLRFHLKKKWLTSKLTSARLKVWRALSISRSPCLAEWTAWSTPQPFIRCPGLAVN